MILSERLLNGLPNREWLFIKTAFKNFYDFPELMWFIGQVASRLDYHLYPKSKFISRIESKYDHEWNWLIRLSYRNERAFQKYVRI